MWVTSVLNLSSALFRRRVWWGGNPRKCFWQSRTLAGRRFAPRKERSPLHIWSDRQWKDSHHAGNKQGWRYHVQVLSAMVNYNYLVKRETRLADDRASIKFQFFSVTPSPPHLYSQITPKLLGYSPPTPKSYRLGCWKPSPWTHVLVLHSFLS